LEVSLIPDSHADPGGYKSGDSLHAGMDPNEVLKRYQKIVYLILIFLFAVIVTFSIVQLIVVLFDSLILNTPLLLENRELLNLFGYFLLVLIGVELLATIAAYLNENVIHAEVVIIIAIIAIVRGVILVEPGSANPLNIVATAALIFALCSGYYFLKKGGVARQ
jgi:uncharacterized membrane protein (DUF373 family)